MKLHYSGKHRFVMRLLFVGLVTMFSLSISAQNESETVRSIVYQNGAASHLLNIDSIAVEQQPQYKIKENHCYLSRSAYDENNYLYVNGVQYDLVAPKGLEEFAYDAVTEENGHVYVLGRATFRTSKKIVFIVWKDFEYLYHTEYTHDGDDLFYTSMTNDFIIDNEDIYICFRYYSFDNGNIHYIKNQEPAVKITYDSFETMDVENGEIYFVTTPKTNTDYMSYPHIFASANVVNLIHNGETVTITKPDLSQRYYSVKIEVINGKPIVIGSNSFFDSDHSQVEWIPGYGKNGARTFRYDGTTYTLPNYSIANEDVRIACTSNIAADEYGNDYFVQIYQTYRSTRRYYLSVMKNGEILYTVDDFSSYPEFFLTIHNNDVYYVLYVESEKFENGYQSYIWKNDKLLETRNHHMHNLVFF